MEKPNLFVVTISNYVDDTTRVRHILTFDNHDWIQKNSSYLKAWLLISDFEHIYSVEKIDISIDPRSEEEYEQMVDILMSINHH